jgi:hypothetical protein
MSYLKAEYSKDIPIVKRETTRKTNEYGHEMKN